MPNVLTCVTTLNSSMAGALFYFGYSIMGTLKIKRYAFITVPPASQNKAVTKLNAFLLIFIGQAAGIFDFL